MTAFGRTDQPAPDAPDVWQQLPQQQHQRGGGPSPEGMGDNSGAGGESRGRSAPGARSRSPSRARGGGRSAAIGPMSDAAISGDPSGRGHPSAISAADRGGGFVGALNEKINRMMTPDLSDPRNPNIGALGLLPGMGLAIGLGAMFQDIGERFGLEMGPAPDVAESGSQGSPEDTVMPGTQAEGTPGQMEAAADQPAQDDGMTPEERERQRRITRGLSWYQGLMGSWAPGTRL